MAVNATAKVPGQRSLSGVDRAAVLLMAMGKPLAGGILKHFNPAEIKRITRAIADLRPVPTVQVEAIIEDFGNQFAKGAHLVGTAGEAEKMLTGVLPPDQINEIMADVLGNANHSIWDRMSIVSEAVLAAYIVKEHPQTAALILSKVKPSCAAKVMGHLPQPLRNALMRRMLNFKPIVDETMRIMEKTIHEDFVMNFSRGVGADTHARIADIINKMERDQMEEVLTSLSTTRPKSAEILKSLLFTFDDIINLAPKARTAIFDQIPNDRVVLALKGTDPGFRDTVLQSLASRVRRMVEQELTSGDPASQRDVTDARRMITDLALEMAGRGEIELNSESDEDAYLR